MRKLFIICTCMFAAVFLAFGLVSSSVAESSVFAMPVDLGDNNDYDDDWGDDWDNDSGWSNDDDWDSSGGGTTGEVPDMPWQLGVIIVAMILISVFVGIRKNKNQKRRKRPYVPQSRAVAPVDNTVKIASAIKKIDSEFSSDKFIAWTREVFFALQYAWMEKDLDKLQVFEKEELFQQHKMQIEQYVKNNRINVLDRINIKQAYLQKYVRDKEYEHISVFMQVRMIDYIKDENTGKILKGSPSVDCHMQYIYTFTRKLGVKSTDDLYKTKTASCPSCGAPTTISSSGKCDHCGSLITTGEFNWVLSKIDHIKANTVVDNSGVIIYE